MYRQNDNRKFSATDRTGRYLWTRLQERLQLVIRPLFGFPRVKFRCSIAARVRRRDSSLKIRLDFPQQIYYAEVIVFEICYSTADTLRFFIFFTCFKNIKKFENPSKKHKLTWNARTPHNYILFVSFKLPLQPGERLHYVVSL